MTRKIVFVKPQIHYDSYTDFWKLVNLSGFEICFLQDINLNQNCIYIISPIDKQFQLSWWQRKRKNAKIILWDLERPKPRGGIKADKKFLSRQNFDEIWVSDPQLANDLGVRYIILGSDEKLGNNPIWIKRYDFTHISYENGRRSVIYEKIKHIGHNGWGKQRDRILRQTKFGLMVHQDNDQYIEPLRLAIFSAYQLPIVSELVINKFPLNDYLLTSDYSQLIDFIYKCLDNYNQLKEMGKEIKQKLCFDYRFENTVRYAIE